MKIDNIQWDVNVDDFTDYLDCLADEVVSSLTGINAKIYSIMSLEERHSYLADLFRFCKKTVYDILELPSSVILNNVCEDNATDYLSDMYGFCIKSLHIN